MDTVDYMHVKPEPEMATKYVPNIHRSQLPDDRFTQSQTLRPHGMPSYTYVQAL